MRMQTAFNNLQRGSLKPLADNAVFSSLQLPFSCAVVRLNEGAMLGQGGTHSREEKLKKFRTRAPAARTPFVVLGRRVTPHVFLNKLPVTVVFMSRGSSKDVVTASWLCTKTATIFLFRREWKIKHLEAVINSAEFYSAHAGNIIADAFPCFPQWRNLEHAVQALDRQNFGCRLITKKGENTYLGLYDLWSEVNLAINEKETGSKHTYEHFGLVTKQGGIHTHIQGCELSYSEPGRSGGGRNLTYTEAEKQQEYGCECLLRNREPRRVISSDYRHRVRPKAVRILRHSRGGGGGTNQLPLKSKCGRERERARERESEREVLAVNREDKLERQREGETVQKLPATVGGCRAAKSDSGKWEEYGGKRIGLVELGERLHHARLTGRWKEEKKDGLSPWKQCLNEPMARNLHRRGEAGLEKTTPPEESRRSKCSGLGGKPHSRAARGRESGTKSIQRNRPSQHGQPIDEQAVTKPGADRSPCLSGAMLSDPQLLKGAWWRTQAGNTTIEVVLQTFNWIEIGAAWRAREELSNNGRRVSVLRHFLAGRADVHPFYATGNVTRWRRLPAANQQIPVVCVDEPVLAMGAVTLRSYSGAPFAGRLSRLLRLSVGLRSPRISTARGAAVSTTVIPNGAILALTIHLRHGPYVMSYALQMAVLAGGHNYGPACLELLSMSKAHTSEGIDKGDASGTENVFGRLFRICVSRLPTRAKQGESGAVPECKEARGENPEKTRRPVTSSGMIPNCETSGATPAGIRTRFSLVRPECSSHSATAAISELAAMFSPCCVHLYWWKVCIGYKRVEERVISAQQQIGGATVAERLARSPPTKAIRVQSPGRVTPDFRMWESWRMMPQVGGFSRGSPVFPPFHSGATPYPQYLDVKSRQNLFTHSTLDATWGKKATRSESEEERRAERRRERPGIYAEYNDRKLKEKCREANKRGRRKRRVRRLKNSLPCQMTIMSCS
ncbi:hypothetical protein PR048_021186 [Dryococelus australis]|uniref:Uncharacterized protein n=1 Tax=Dryococelus australis TaxID=614101 RepID=A0ABQ9GXI1_9NEOP|nr:hypothetical protein PR048_021186 [Dryococelus australis]